MMENIADVLLLTQPCAVIHISISANPGLNSKSPFWFMRFLMAISFKTPQVKKSVELEKSCGKLLTFVTR